MLIDLIGELLQERDWKLVSLRDARTASEFLRQTRPDVILLDVHLGGSAGGWEILDQLKASPDTHAIPVVVWSGDSRVLESKRAWLRDQDISVLPKPFEIDDLYRSLDTALGISAFA
jgi:CheY-like chemotaxis protein